MKRLILFVAACVLMTIACNIGPPVSPTESPRTDGNGGTVGSAGNGDSGDSGGSAGLSSGEQTEEPTEPQSISVGDDEDIPPDVPDHLFFGGLGYVSGLFGCYDIETLPDEAEVLQYPSGQASKRNCFCTDTNPGVDQVSATLTLPDGIIIHVDAPVTEWEDEGAYCAEFNYAFDSGMSMGTHRIEMNLGEQAIDYEFIPVPGYLFYGYLPNESVRLLLFTDGFGGAFMGERYLNADDNGQVYLQLSNDSTWDVLGGEPDKSDNTQYPAIVAFGETTPCKIISPGYSLNPNLLDCNIELVEDDGTFILEDPIIVPFPLEIPSIIFEWTPCKDIYPSRLNVGDIATPPLEPIIKNSVYLKPDHKIKLLGQIVSGEKVEILDGPECNKDRVWWYISSLSQNLEGWVAEGDGFEYWLVLSD